MQSTRRYFQLGACVIATLVCACSTISTRQTLHYPHPPEQLMTATRGLSSSLSPADLDRQIEAQYLLHPSKEARALSNYKRAMLWAPSDPGKACTIWSDLLQDADFPLRRLVQIRALAVCSPPQPQGWSDKDVLSSVTTPWMDELAVRSALERSIRLGKKEDEARLRLQVADYEKSQGAKVAQLQAALAIAKSLKSSELISAADLRLAYVSPRFMTNPPPTRFIDVANDFKLVRDFVSARKWYERVINDQTVSTDDQLKALDGVRQTYKLAIDSAAYVRATKRYAKFARQNLYTQNASAMRRSNTGLNAMTPAMRTDFDKYFRVQLALARTLWTDNQPAEARNILLSAEKDLSRFISTDESILILARIEEERGNFDKALQILERINVANITDHDFKSRVEWQRGWYLHKLKRNSDAAIEFERQVQEDPNNPGLARVHFWLARALRESGQTAAADEQLAWLTQNDVMGYYGLLAYREMHRQIPALVLTQAKPDASTVLSSDDQLMFEWLQAAGEKDLAANYLDYVTNGKRAALTEAQAATLLELYKQTERYDVTLARVFEIAAPERNHILATDPTLAFPSPYNEVVNAAAARFSVKPEMIYAIMRQESAFNPMARSPSDAFGLMQLIPEAAQKASAAAGMQFKQFDELYRPETNIQLGASFLKELLDHWNGSFISTAASYNSSEKAIRAWIASRYHGDSIEFIEDIPYEETRNYVKLVMRNFIFYSRLNSKQPIDFPEWCLANIHSDRP